MVRPLVGSLQQYASVRRIALDDGAERGVRAVAFSTGGGLDFWLIADRALDIGPLSWRGTPIAWQAPHGFRSPALHVAESDGGYGFDRAFSGLLATCGLDHIRQPSGSHPHHGRIAMTPARITAYGETWDAGEPLLYCEGEILQSRYKGEALLLRRRVEAPIGGAELRIVDRVENVGPDPTPQALLYHFNFGFPGIGQGTTLTSDEFGTFDALEFGRPDAEPAVLCRAAGAADGTAACTLRAPLQDGSERIISLFFETSTLPFIQVYRDLRANSGFLAIEPCTSERIGAGGSSPEQTLKPGESRTYKLRLSVGGGFPAALAP
jgi:hypothetical protein